MHLAVLVQAWLITLTYWLCSIIAFYIILYATLHSYRDFGRLLNQGKILSKIVNRRKELDVPKLSQVYMGELLVHIYSAWSKIYLHVNGRMCLFVISALSTLWLLSYLCFRNQKKIIEILCRKAISNWNVLWNVFGNV